MVPAREGPIPLFFSSRSRRKGLLGENRIRSRMNDRAKASLLDGPGPGRE
jgi:hypothetical protein